MTFNGVAVKRPGVIFIVFKQLGFAELLEFPGLFLTL